MAPGHYSSLQESRHILINSKNMDWDEFIIPNIHKAFWLCIQIILKPENCLSWNHVFKVCTSARFLGGYIGGRKSKYDWLKEHIETWEKKSFTVRKTTGKYPQESYSAVVCAIQSECIFLQRVTRDTGDSSTWVEKMIQEIFCLVFYLERHNPSHPS